jgi:hypothetical protein
MPSFYRIDWSQFFVALFPRIQDFLRNFPLVLTEKSTDNLDFDYENWLQVMLLAKYFAKVFDVQKFHFLLNSRYLS